MNGFFKPFGGADMKRRLWSLIALPLMVWWLGPCGAAQASQAGKTAEGWDYVSGGVSHEELVELHARRDNFSLWVVTAAMKSGAYLADVRITIHDKARKRVVFDQRIDGPWLFVALPLGAYDVEATLNGQSQRRTTTIHPGDHHQAFFYFDVPDQVGAESRAPFEKSPYGNSKP
jgi:hypothetical protein